MAAAAGLPQQLTSDRLQVRRGANRPGVTVPALDKETVLFPEDLFEAARQPSDRRWWVIYTRARQEKALARILESKDVPFYLPQVRNQRVVRSRKVCSYLPLFPGYVFLYGTDDDRVTSLASNKISQIIEVGEQDRLCEDLQQIHRLVESGAALSPESCLEPGHQVRIKSGALKGLEGTVLSRQKRQRLVVSVKYIQRGVSVEIDDYMLERI